MSGQATIAIVDDDDAVRDSLDVLIRADGRDTLLFANATDFLAANRSNVACILLDVRLPDGDGIQILQHLMEGGECAPIIIITGHGDVPMAVRAMQIGAVDFVEKPFDPDLLLESVERAVAHVHERAETKPSSVTTAKQKIARLTRRESEVLGKLVLGRQNKMIAQELGLSPRTVEVHRARVMEKTGAGSLSELVRLAIAAGIEPDDDV